MMARLACRIKTAKRLTEIIAGYKIHMKYMLYLSEVKLPQV